MDRDDDDARPRPSDREGDGGGRAEPGSGAAADAPDATRPGSTDVHAYIGRQLRAVYDDVVKQPIPERFLDLMKQLEGLPRR